MVNVGWFCFKWGLVLGLIAVIAAAAYFYQRVDEEVRLCVQQRIAQHYTDLKVTVRSAEVVEGKGIEVRGLSIVEPGAEGPRAELVYCDELFLTCPTDLQELISGQPQVKRITFRRPTLRLTRRPDGTWSAAKLLPLPKFSERPPEVTIENGAVEIFDPLKTPTSTLALRDLGGTLSPPDPQSPNPQSPNPQSPNPQSPNPQSPNPQSPNPQMRKFQGVLNADHLGRVELEALIDPESLQWTVSGTVEGLDVSPELADTLPGPLAAQVAPLRALRGQGTLRFQVSCDPAAESPYRFDLSGQIVRGRLDDARLPHPLTDVQAKFRVNNDGLAIDELTARSGRTELRVLSARQAGFDFGTSPLWLQAEVRQLDLDRRLFECLPESLRGQWHKYSPEGRINAVARFHFDGRKWHPDLEVELLDVAFTHYKFPYRLEHAKGSLTWKQTADGDFLEVHSIAYSGSQAVRLDAGVLHPNSGPTGWFEAQGTELRLDKKFLDALNEKSRAFVSSLNPSGTIDVHRVRLWRDVPEGPWHKYFEIGLNRCSIRYKEFPYPLNNVRGTLVMRDDSWTFHGLEGTNDTGVVTCTEGWLKPPQEGRELYMHLVATNVPLEEELREALRDHVQRAWNNLRPRGVVDLDAQVHYLPERKKLSVAVTAYPQPDSTSIEPVYFPYRLEKLRGVLTYRDGHVTLERFRAEHGRVKVATGGSCDFSPDGTWQFHLKGLTVDGLRLDDRDLIQALPARLKKAIVELQPTGAINLQGDVTLGGYAGAHESVGSQWDVTAVFRPGASIDCGLRLENLSGSVRLTGASDGHHFYSRGELFVDSLTWKDFQFTQVMGPLWIDDRQVLLGSWVDRRHREAVPNGAPPTQPRTLTGKLFGGTVYGDGWIMLAAEPRYGIRVTLSQADLSRLALETMAGRQNLKGKITATANLRGTGRTLNGLGGQGTVQLRHGDVYQLPFMIELLAILSIQPPDQTAFSTSDIDFRIEGEHIYLDRINFNGDAISLYGAGEMNFQQSIRMNFNAIVGRGDLPLIKELLSGASQQIMQIRVGGTLQNPDIRKEPFPVVSQALQQLQKDLQKGNNPQSHFPQSRQGMPNIGSRGRSRR